MQPTNKFKVGEIVVFKNHPLLYDYEIKGDGKYVPPLMIVKEILFENKQKRTHDEMSGFKVADKIKYICIYFDDNKSEFIENHLYEPMLETIQDLHIARIDDPENLGKDHVPLVDEIINYPISPSYEYGKIIYFKTKKLEVLKKRTSKTITTKDDLPKETKKTLQYVVNYATPEFIISGYKKENYSDLFYNDGKTKRIASNEFVKIQWFNPIQQKYSEQFIPIECFTDIQPFDTNLPHHKTHLIKPEPAVKNVGAN